MTVATHREGEWLGSPNCTPGRQGGSVVTIVLHTMCTDIAGANAKFQDSRIYNPDTRGSATYGVGSDGRIVQWVDEADGAWHAGDWTVNMTSIGIEHEDHGNYNGVRPDALYTASAALVRELCGRYGIPINNDRILSHRQITATSCPDGLDVDRIVIEAAHPPQPTPKPTAGDIGTMIARNHFTNQWETVCRGTDNGIWHAAGTAAQLQDNPAPGSPGSLWVRVDPGNATTPAQPSVAVDPVTGEGAILCIGDDRKSLYLSERPQGAPAFGTFRKLANASTTT